MWRPIGRVLWSNLYYNCRWSQNLFLSCCFFGEFILIMCVCHLFLSFFLFSFPFSFIYSLPAINIYYWKQYFKQKNPCVIPPMISDIVTAMSLAELTRYIQQLNLGVKSLFSFFSPISLPSALLFLIPLVFFHHLFPVSYTFPSISLSVSVTGTTAVCGWIFNSFLSLPPDLSNLISLTGYPCVMFSASFCCFVLL